MYYKIEQLKNILASHRNCVFSLDKLCESALEYIQHLESGVDRCYELAKQLEAAQPKWISVEERLPGESGSYLVCTRRSDAFTAHFYLNTNEWKSHFAGSAGKHITHWMPMPPAPDETTTPKEAD